MHKYGRCECVRVLGCRWFIVALERLGFSAFCLVVGGKTGLLRSIYLLITHGLLRSCRVWLFFVMAITSA